MADVLSQQEIDSLLSGIGTGAPQPTDFAPQSFTSSSSEIMNYDFRRPNRISKNQVRMFQQVHEQFGEALGYYLVSKLQTMASISVTSVDQLFYSEYILSVSNPSCLYVFDIEGTDGKGIFEISPQLALCLVERLLGGSADIARKPRLITEIEKAVMRNVIEHAFAELSNKWKSIAEINFRYSHLESEADFVQIAPSSEIVIVVSFDVHIGMHSYLMNICFPTFALEDVITRLNRQSVSAGTGGHPERLRDNMSVMQQQIATTFLPVQAELGKASITVADLLDLQMGDVIKLDAKINQELQISINGKRKLAGRPGTLDGKKAVRVTRSLVEDDMVESDTRYKG